MEDQVNYKYLFAFHPHKEIILDSGEASLLLANCTVIMFQGGGIMNFTVHSPALAWDKLVPKLINSIDGHFAIPGVINYSSPKMNTITVSFDIPRHYVFDIGWWLFARVLRTWGIKRLDTAIPLHLPQMSFELVR